MKKLLLSTVVSAGLMIGGVSSFAQEGMKVPGGVKVPSQVPSLAQEGIKIPGEITSISTEDNVNYTVEIKDQAGNSHTFTVPSSEQVQALKKGDTVEISFQKAAGGTMKKGSQ
ncbi:MAG TPA: hypothetical protein VLB01_03870 [Thermodesulfobacteriota bacterium]|nr:hypothetical protein [Thermodesulfobacteriota bacterium]